MEQNKLGFFIESNAFLMIFALPFYFYWNVNISDLSLFIFNSDFLSEFYIIIPCFFPIFIPGFLFISGFLFTAILKLLKSSSEDWLELNISPLTFPSMFSRSFKIIGSISDVYFLIIFSTIVLLSNFFSLNELFLSIVGSSVYLFIISYTIVFRILPASQKRLKILTTLLWCCTILLFYQFRNLGIHFFYFFIGDSLPLVRIDGVDHEVLKYHEWKEIDFKLPYSSNNDYSGIELEYFISNSKELLIFLFWPFFFLILIYTLHCFFDVFLQYQNNPKIEKKVIKNEEELISVKPLKKINNAQKIVEFHVKKSTKTEKGNYLNILINKNNHSKVFLMYTTTPNEKGKKGELDLSLFDIVFYKNENEIDYFYLYPIKVKKN